MTRKRYIKLLMSKGYSRNSAREEADYLVDYNQKVAKDNKAYKAQNIFYRIDSLCYEYDYYGNLIYSNKKGEIKR